MATDLGRATAAGGEHGGSGVRRFVHDFRPLSAVEGRPQTEGVVPQTNIASGLGQSGEGLHSELHELAVGTVLDLAEVGAPHHTLRAKAFDERRDEAAGAAIRFHRGVEGMGRELEVALPMFLRGRDSF